MGKYYLEKERFMKSLMEYSVKENRYIPIQIFHNFGNKYQYTLVFDWTSIKPNGEHNYMALAQLYDNRKSGVDKYITTDLNFDMREKGIRTDYGLYKFLRDWAQESIKKYECEINQYSENCEECGFCKHTKFKN
nr:MAG TPA: hypothetical protein [Caudoviricetes sp.]